MDTDPSGQDGPHQHGPAVTCTVILEVAEDWQPQRPSGQGPASMQTPSRPGSRRQDMLSRAGMLSQILRSPRATITPQRGFRCATNGQSDLLHWRRCAEEGPGLCPLQEPPGDRGRCDSSQTGLLQRGLVTWSPHGWDAASMDRAGQVRRGQDSRPSLHPPGTRTRVTLGRNACLLRAAGGRDKTTRESARGLGARPRRTPRPGSPPGH